MITFAICTVAGVIALVVFLLLFTLVGLPLMFVLGLAPWALGVFGMVLLIKGLLEKPFAIANLTPAAIALGLSVVLRWIF